MYSSREGIAGKVWTLAVVSHSPARVLFTVLLMCWWARTDFSPCEWDRRGTAAIFSTRNTLWRLQHLLTLAPAPKRMLLSPQTNPPPPERKTPPHLILLQIEIWLSTWILRPVFSSFIHSPRSSDGFFLTIPPIKTEEISRAPEFAITVPHRERTQHPLLVVNCH